MSEKKITIVSPVNGKAVLLEQVPDAVFADKILGDGMAVIPSDGEFFSPVNGVVTSVAESLHAIGFQTEDGLDVLMHIGLDTVKLGGEGFQVFVKEGDKVKAGDAVVQVNLRLLADKGLNPITPIVICDGLDDRELEYAEGAAEAGKTEICAIRTGEKSDNEEAAESMAGGQVTIETTENKVAGVQARAGDAGEKVVTTKAAQKEATGSDKKPKKKLKLNFDFLQKLGKVLMAVIAVMPAAGLMISLGKVVQMAGADANTIAQLTAAIKLYNQSPIKRIIRSLMHVL